MTNDKIAIFLKINIKLSHSKAQFFFHLILRLNPFTGDFDLPKRICLNELFLFFFDKVRHFLSKFSTLVMSQKKCFLHFLKHRKVFSKNVVLQVFLSNLNNHLFLKCVFFIDFLMCKLVTFLKICKVVFYLF
jgi:hypothetical protein